MSELGPEINVYRNSCLVRVKATRCKKCGHFHDSASGCEHISHPFKEHPWIIFRCSCMDLETWEFMEQKKLGEEDE